MNKQKTLKIILILIILIFIIYFLKQIYKTNNFDDYLFIKLNSNGNLVKTQDIKKYEFNVRYKNTESKTINLVDTQNTDILINRKIAPGTNGVFYITLNANKKLNYKVNFISNNSKPQNLKFKVEIQNKFLGQFNTLDEISNKLVGTINKNETIKIKLDWFWNYENEGNEMQDTIDAQNINLYKFDILVTGIEDM